MNITHRNTCTITESLNDLFCKITMNPHPVHTNVEYAKKAKHGKILVCGPLVFSLAVGLTVPEISQDAVCTLEYGRIIHHKPVFIGDTIRVESWKSEKYGRITTYDSAVYNQKDKLVLSFYRKVLK